MDDGAQQPRPLSAEEEAFLSGLARLVVYTPRAFAADLGRAHGFGMSEYFTLMHLSEAPGARLRMGDLAAESALSQAAVTRVVSALEAKGFVTRQPCPTDGRGHEAVLTEAGRSRLGQVRPAMVASVRHRIFDKLAGLDLEPLAEAMVRMSRDD